AGALRGTGRSRGPALGIVELPAGLTVLRPGHERAPVGGRQGENAGPHARAAGRPDLGLLARVTSAVQAGAIDLPPRGPGRYAPAPVGGDRVIGHGARVDLPRGAADPLPLDPAPGLVP